MTQYPIIKCELSSNPDVDIPYTNLDDIAGKEMKFLVRCTSEDCARCDISGKMILSCSFILLDKTELAKCLREYIKMLGWVLATGPWTDTVTNTYNTCTDKEEFARVCSGLIKF